MTDKKRLMLSGTPEQVKDAVRLLKKEVGAMQLSEEDDPATEHLRSVASREEEALIKFARLLYPNIAEEELRALLREADGGGENIDGLLNYVVRRGLRGSLDKQAQADKRTTG